jgi:hypothetical protein
LPLAGAPEMMILGGSSFDIWSCVNAARRWSEKEDESGWGDDVDPHIGRNGRKADADPNSRKNADNKERVFRMMFENG